MPSERNYHSSKLEFFTLKLSVTEHFKEYLTYTLFVIQMDNNPLTYILTTPTSMPWGTSGWACWPPMNLL